MMCPVLFFSNLVWIKRENNIQRHLAVSRDTGTYELSDVTLESSRAFPNGHKQGAPSRCAGTSLREGRNIPMACLLSPAPSLPPSLPLHACELARMYVYC